MIDRVDRVAPLGGRGRLQALAPMVAFDIAGPLIVYYTLSGSGFSTVGALILSGILPAFGIGLGVRPGRRRYPIGPSLFRRLSREYDERPQYLRTHWRAMTVLGTSHARSLGGHESSIVKIPALQRFAPARSCHQSDETDIERGLANASRTRRLDPEPRGRPAGVDPLLRAHLGVAHPRRVDRAVGRLSRTRRHEGKGHAGVEGIERRSGQVW